MLEESRRTYLCNPTILVETRTLFCHVNTSLLYIVISLPREVLIGINC